MTIKEAFEKLHKAVKKAGMNPFFLIGNLKDEFKDIADNVVDAGGSVVDVEPLYTEGIPIADISVDGETSRLYTPYITTLDLYSDTEHKVGVWYHDSISEDVYERTYSLDNISTSSGSPTELIPSSYMILDIVPAGIYTVSGVSYVFNDLVFVNSVNNDSFNLRLSLQKGTNNYIIHKEGSGTVSNGVLTLRYVKRV